MEEIRYEDDDITLRSMERFGACDVTSIYLVCRGRKWTVEDRPPEGGSYHREYRFVNGSAGAGQVKARMLAYALQGNLPRNVRLPESLLR